MAKQAKRRRLAPLATSRSSTDALDAGPESATSQIETAAADSGGQAGLVVATLLHDHADLAGANLARADLCDASLRFAILSAADLEAADLSRADLQLAIFNQANLGGANLSSAVLDHASFAGANLSKAKLCGASLRFAHFEAAKLGAADLSSADLRHARLDRADFRAANLSGAQLDYADFSGANLADANLGGAHLRYAKNLTKSQLDESHLSASTTLPLYFEDSHCLPWKSDQSRATGNRPIWIAGALLAALACLGLVWQLIDPRKPMPLQAQANAGAVQAVGAEVVSLKDTISARWLHSLASAASHVAMMTRAEFALLRPVVSVPTFAAATSDALPVVALAPPAHTARHGGDGDFPSPLSVPDTVPSTKVVAYRLAVSPQHLTVLSDVPSPFLMPVTALQTVAVRELRVEELAREYDSAPGNPLFASPGFAPITLVVSLRDQQIYVYRGTDLIMSSKVSSGKRGYDTRAGVFSILEKQRHHHSNLYSGAPMPWMQRLTWTGTALHGGVVPGYPASHGCIRLPFSFAPKLFQMTTLGANVVVAGNRVAPKPLEHVNLFQPVPTPAEVALAAAESDLFARSVLSTAAAAERPELADSKVQAAADTPSGAPLRILVTRRTNQDQVISTQYLLAALGYLTPQNFSGRIGPETIVAIKAFQNANGLRETGAFSDELAKKVHQVAGKAEPPPGHLFVRQDFRPVFDVPITFREPEQSLGTHVFTMGLTPGSAKAAWAVISLEGGDSASVLDRIEIPDDIRQTISERLTPGSSLIVADTSVNSAILPDGDDFLVLAKATPAVAALEPRQGAKQERAKTKRAKAANAVAKSRVQGTRKRAARPIYRGPDPYGGFRLFRRW